MYFVFCESEPSPNGHLYSGWGGLCETYESDLKTYLVFEEEDGEHVQNMFTFIGGKYIRYPSGDWEYSPFGDVNWSQWEDETESSEKWYERVLEAARPASEMEAEFEELLEKGYALYCKI